MAWARIDDKFLDNPKVRKAGKDATYLYVSGLVYSSNQLTEGYISDEALGLVAYKGFIKNERTHAATLVECELWDRIEGGYQIHDYLEYNPTKEQIEEARAKKAAAGSKGAQARWQNDSKPIASAIATASKNDGKTMAPSCDTDGINPSHPIPILNPLKEPTNQSSSIAEKGDDDDLFRAFETIAAVTPEVRKAINQAADSYGAAWVRDAIAEGVVHGAKSFAYVNRILASWKANGKPSNGNKQPGADVERFRELYRKQKQGAK